MNTPPGESAASARIGRPILALLLAAMLAISSAYGLLLLLPLYLKVLGGTEATFGALTAASALPAVVVLTGLLRFPDRVRPPVVLAGAAAVYALTAAALSQVGSIGITLGALVLVLGSTWAVIYTVGPMVVSEHVPDTARAAYIGYVTGTVQLGFGIGPVLGGSLHARGWTYPATFLFAAALAAVAAGLAYLSAVIRPRHSARSAAPADRRPVELRAALGRILRSPALRPLAMILLLACLFTTMNSFQTTFAQLRGLSFDVFYTGYTVSVIAVRLVMARFFRDTGTDRTVIVATAGVSVAVLGFLAVGSHVALYATFSVLLGGAYGLALPAIQARAVNFAPIGDRARMLPLAGLLFQIVILGFPMVAGAVIATFGYQTVFLVLFCLAAAVWLLSLQRSPRDSSGQLPVTEARPTASP
ncbi:MFS transporter [Dactylosporangium sp. NPDC049525]|uniref:MFS transporter n=1 Tax=Dactylosporangium sp. NPDC049525 TaxID=3154730 RepID=UPI0034357562